MNIHIVVCKVTAGRERVMIMAKRYKDRSLLFRMFFKDNPAAPAQAAVYANNPAPAHAHAPRPAPGPEHHRVTHSPNVRPPAAPLAFCTQCGQRNTDMSVFCTECGNNLKQ